MKLRIFVLIALTQLGLNLGTRVQNDSCSPELLAKAIKGPYGYKTRGNRCEGYYESEVGGGAYLFLQGITRGNLPKLKQTDILTLYVAGGNYETAKVTATMPGEFYSMHAILRKGEKLKWPLKEALFKSNEGGVAISETAEVLVRGEVGDDFFIPICLESKAHDLQNTMVLRFVNSKEISTYAWRIFDLKNMKIYQEWKTIGLKTRAGKPFNIVIDDVHTLPPAIKLELRVTSRVSANQQIDVKVLTR